MNILIPYDVSDDKRRREVDKILSSFGKRINYSVFELQVTKVQYREIIGLLEEATDPKYDHIRIYILGLDSLKKSFILHSNQKVFEYEELYI